MNNIREFLRRSATGRLGLALSLLLVILALAASR